MRCGILQDGIQVAHVRGLHDNARELQEKFRLAVDETRRPDSSGD